MIRKTRCLVLLIGILFFGFGMGVHAQKFNGGLLAGINTSQVDGDNYGGYYKAGITGGGFVNYKLTRYAGLQMELYYIRKGAGKKPDETNATYYKVKLNYIELPVVFFYEASDRLIFEGGLAYGVLATGTEDMGAGDIIPEDYPFDKNDYSGLLGVGYRLGNNVIVDIRYSHSLLPIRNHPGNKTWLLNRGQYNNCLTFTLRYQL